MAEAMMLSGWGGSSSIVAQERLIIQQRVQQRLLEQKRARELEAEQRDWLEQSVLYRTVTKGSTGTTVSATSDVSRGSSESATEYYFSSNSGHDHSHFQNSAWRKGDVAGQVPATNSDMMQTPRTVSNTTIPANPMITSISSASTGSSTQPPPQPQALQDSIPDLLRDPYELRHGRRYLRDLAYPLPVDLPEIQRQNLRTLLGCAVFGRAVCAPKATKQVPQRVLEVGCGSAYWSARCHEYFTSLGHHNVSFTGLDVAPLAPDLKKQGVNWTFVQHDMRRNPWPFEDETFDFIMLKDLSLVVPLGSAYQHFLDECIRLLQVGGTMEIWESDHVLRSLLPHPVPPPNVKQRTDHDMAVSTGTFLIGPGTPFAPAQNKYLTHANTWISEALDRRKLPPMPCARVANVLYQEPESLSEVGIRRVAIPLGELRWERDRCKQGGGNEASPNGTGKGKNRERNMSPDQVALRQTALLSVVQMIESLEPLLKDVSGKNSEEWGHWWASMMADLMDPSRGAISGECLEMGAWWATKIEEE
jgi:SAM-dependent methyltransferase